MRLHRRTGITRCSRGGFHGVVKRSARKIEVGGSVGPAITSRGKFVNAGTMVATPALVPSGAQQWMCAATSGDVKTLKLALISSVLAVVSSLRVTKPVPGELTGLGNSFAPERLAVKISVAA